MRNKHRNVPYVSTPIGDAEEAVRTLLRFVGEDPNREGLLETPSRVTKSLKELCSGYDLDPSHIFKVFEDGVCDEMVLLKNIELNSFS